MQTQDYRVLASRQFYPSLFWICFIINRSGGGREIKKKEPQCLLIYHLYLWPKVKASKPFQSTLSVSLADRVFLAHWMWAAPENRWISTPNTSWLYVHCCRTKLIKNDPAVKSLLPTSISLTSTNCVHVSWPTGKQCLPVSQCLLVSSLQTDSYLGWGRGSGFFFPFIVIFQSFTSFLTLSWSCLK